MIIPKRMIVFLESKSKEACHFFYGIGIMREIVLSIHIKELLYLNHRFVHCLKRDVKLLFDTMRQ